MSEKVKSSKNLTTERPETTGLVARERSKNQKNCQEISTQTDWKSTSTAILTWKCHHCTFENVGAYNCCQMCQLPKGTNLCPACTYDNSLSCIECEVCGVLLQPGREVAQSVSDSEEECSDLFESEYSDEDESKPIINLLQGSQKKKKMSKRTANPKSKNAQCFVDDLWDSESEEEVHSISDSSEDKPKRAAILKRKSQNTKLETVAMKLKKASAASNVLKKTQDKPDKKSSKSIMSVKKTTPKYKAPVGNKTNNESEQALGLKKAGKRAVPTCKDTEKEVDTAQSTSKRTKNEHNPALVQVQNEILESVLQQSEEEQLRKAMDISLQEELKNAGSSEWQWCNDEGEWIKYLAPEQLNIEEAFKANLEEVCIITNQTSQIYRINTKKLTQTNVNYGTIRKIRRVLNPNTDENFEWRWCHEDGQWVSYSQLYQTQIEDAFRKQKEVTFTALENGQTYCVDTSKLLQTNLNNGSMRTIQRILKADVLAPAPLLKIPKVNFQYPCNWIQFDEDSRLQICSIVKTSAEYIQVSRQFHHSCCSTGYTINTISRIQNIDRFNEYQLYRSELVKALGIDGVNEKKLFHGTDHQAADGICNHGFDWRRCGKNGTLYGNGTYFACNSKYSAEGYSKQNSSGECKMFLATVLVGRYSQGSAGLSVPPEGFHSLVDNVSSPTIFVVFERKQSYPEYLICFRKV